MRSLATEQAVKILQNAALLESESDLLSLGRGCHCAVFHSGAAPDQTPRLETSILFAQQYRLPSGKEVHFPPVLAPGAVSELIGRWEWRRLSEKLGTFGLTERTQIPENLFSTPSLRDLGRNDKTHADRRLAGSELFAAWRNQAAIKGFDEERVEAMFAAGRLLGIGSSILEARRHPGTAGAGRAQHPPCPPSSTHLTESGTLNRALSNPTRRLLDAGPAVVHLAGSFMHRAENQCRLRRA
jgi:hypothetical protein